MKKLTRFVSIFLCFAMMFTLASCSGKSKAPNSPESVVEKFFEAYSNFDADGMLDCINEGVLQKMANEMFDGDLDEFKETYKRLLDSFYKEKLEDVKLSINVLESKDLEGEDFNEIKEYFAENYDVEISAAASVKFEMTAKGEVEGVVIDNTEEETYTVVKVDGKWYIDYEDTLPTPSQTDE